MASTFKQAPSPIHKGFLAEVRAMTQQIARIPVTLYQARLEGGVIGQANHRSALVQGQDSALHLHWNIIDSGFVLSRLLLVASRKWEDDMW